MCGLERVEVVVLKVEGGVVKRDSIYWVEKAKMKLFD